MLSLPSDAAPHDLVLYLEGSPLSPLETSPPSSTDEFRSFLREYAERQSLRFCYFGEWGLTPDGKSYPLDCGNKWACPQCSPKLLDLDRQDIARVLHASVGVLFMTFSISHDDAPGVALKPLHDVWNAAFSTGSWMGDLRARSGIVGHARGTEVTFPESGPHPHFHVVFVLDRRPSQKTVDSLYDRWITKATKLGFTASREAMELEGYDASVPPGKARDAVAYYLTEQNAIRESRPGKGRTPGDLLRSAMQGDADDLALLRAYHAATKAQQKIVFSQGFRNLVPVDHELATASAETVSLDTVELPWFDTPVEHTGPLTKRQERVWQHRYDREVEEQARRLSRAQETAPKAKGEPLLWEHWPRRNVEPDWYVRNGIDVRSLPWPAPQVAPSTSEDDFEDLLLA